MEVFIICKEKYIYFIKDSVYRIKIIKKNPKINYNKYFKCDLEEAIKIRNEILKNNNVSLKKKIKENQNILIEKYIYKTATNKYRLFIRCGNYYYSKTFKTLLEARKERKIKMSEKILINNKKERKIGFDQMLSLYTNKRFTITKEIKELLEFIFDSNNSEDYNQSLIADYIDKKYPIFRQIDICNINIDNVWDWLEEQKEKHGDEFIMMSLV